DGIRDATVTGVRRVLFRSPHGVSARFLADVPPAGQPSGARGRGILFCGTWDAMKGVHYLAAAYSTLVARGRRTPLTVLGGAVPRSEERRVGQEGRSR